MKRTPLKRKTPLKRSTLRKKRPREKSKNKTKGYSCPKWFMALPTGSHGNTPAQKRLWKLISDTYREDDFYKYNGRCVSCHRKLEDWHDGDLGHYKAYSVCHSWFKYERKNLALQCKGCNRLSDGPVGLNFAAELILRHGEDVIDWIEQTNEGFRGMKMETWQIVDYAAKLRPDLVDEEL